jgi:N4-gp56 family major capsid protein
MAVVFGTNDALTAKRWSAVLYKETMRDMFFAKFTGTSKDNIIQTDMDLTKNKGDKMTFGLRMRMTGAGQESATGITLQGNEEDLVFHDFSVGLVIAGHSVKAKSELDEQRPAFSYRAEMKEALKEWSIEKLEDKLITALTTSPTANRRINVGTGQPTSGETFGTSLISQMKRKARLKVSGMAKIRPPVKLAGRMYFACLAHDYDIKSLKAETAWLQAQREANIRGNENPIFNGMDGTWDQVAIHSYERCPLYTGNVARSILLGAQAGVIAYGHPFKWWEDLLDGNRIPWLGTTVIWGVAKTVYNSEDFGVITADSLYTPDS